MKRSIIISIILVSLAHMGHSQEYKSFRAGEKASYYIHYGILSGGVASLELREDTIFGKDVIYGVLTGKTTGIADVIYKVRDYYHSYFDPTTLLPVKAIRDISESRYRKYNELVFDHYARPDSALVHSQLTGTHITPNPIWDIISCFYHLRENYLASGYQLKEGEVITIMTWFTDELYPIRLRFKGYETVRTPFGKIECLKFNPVTEVGRVFKTEEDMTIWFSNDKNYLPIKIRFDIFVGKVTVDIEKYEGLAWPLNFSR
ncbi:MAG: DUF3108 domain-containing protein [Bacteroidales bacterium]|nr:DUF3108 domain-containing protein [Bacteroidales bacterium]